MRGLSGARAECPSEEARRDTIIDVWWLAVQSLKRLAGKPLFSK